MIELFIAVTIFCLGLTTGYIIGMILGYYLCIVDRLRIKWGR